MPFQSRGDKKTNGWLVFLKLGKGPISESINFVTRWSFQRICSAQSSVVGNFLCSNIYAFSINFWRMNFVQEVAKPLKERYPSKTLYLIVPGLRRFVEKNNEKLDFNPLEASDKRCIQTYIS